MIFKRSVKIALKNDYQRIKKRIEAGVGPMDIGQKTIELPGNKVLIKGSHGRYLFETFHDQVDVLGIGNLANAQNIETFKNLMNDLYGLDLKY